MSERDDESTRPLPEGPQEPVEQGTPGHDAQPEQRPQPEQPAQTEAPYAQPQYGQWTYGGAPETGSPQYGSPQYGDQYGASQYGSPYAPTPYTGGAPAQSPSVPPSTIVLAVISGLATLTCWGAPVGLAPMIMAIIALASYKQDIDRARRLTRWGWIVFGILAAVAALIIILIIVLAIASNSNGSTYDL
ncbi:MAG TPA: hypothetical protein VFX41_00295 [Actinomycetales bacterium]|nr:hypothetical protein [Actinomycetales bacterium]